MPRIGSEPKLLTFLRGTKKERKALKQREAILYSYFEEVWDVRCRHMVKNLPEQYVCMLVPCFQKGCPHLKCQAGEDQVGLKWFPNGSSVEYFPIPIPDPNRPWGADCSTCKGTSAGHFLRPDDHQVHYRNYGREGMMAKPASKILGDAHKKLLVVKKTLLPTDHVQMWLEHLGEEHKNRVEGAERAAAKKQSMSRKRY